MTKPALFVAGVLGCLLAVLYPATSALAGSLEGYRLLILGQSPVKWGLPIQGTGSSATYAIATHSAVFDGERNCSAIGSMAGLLAASHTTSDAFAAQVEAAFAAWSAAADITFVRVDEADADILIGAQLQPSGRAFTNVVRGNSDPLASAARIVRSVICLNPVVPWKIGFDGNLAAYDLRYTLTHEIGHAIGLDHPGTPGELMDFRYGEQFAGLQAGDISGAISLYGPARLAVIGAASDSGTAIVAAQQSP